MNVGQTSARLEKHGNNWTVRVYESGLRVRKIVCPVSGPDALKKVARQNKGNQILSDANHGNKAPLPEVLPVDGHDKITFREAAERWLKKAQQRKKRPLTFNTARLYSHYLIRWINPVIGDLPVSQVKTYKAKLVIDKLAEAKSSTSVVSDTFNIIRKVVASLKDEDGEPVFNVKWDLEEIDMPDTKKANSKSFTAAQVEQIILRSAGQYRVMFMLLAATGIRIAECQAIEIGGDTEKVTTLSPDCRVLHVNTQLLQNGEIQDWPKTDAGRREVDIHPDIAKLLLAHIDKRTSGYLFCAKTGNPLSYANIRKNKIDKILYDVEHPIMKREGKGWKKVGVNKTAGVVGGPETAGYGFHSFRRFRNTFLTIDAAINDAFTKFWMGHGKKGMTEHYTKVLENSGKRREVCEQAGYGFNLPAIKLVKAVKSKGKKAA